MLVVALIGACSGSGASNSSLPHSPAVLSAYHAWWSDYSAATRIFPINPSNPRLSEHMTGSELTKIQAQLSYMKSRDQYIKGPLVDDSRAEVTKLGPATATVQDCYLDPSYLVDGVTGAVENQPDSSRVLARISLTLAQGQWKVSNFMSLEIGCSHAT